MPAATDDTETYLLEAVQLTKRFSLVLADDKVDFNVRRGEIHCLLGENGAGKTTLAECLYGFYKPDEGEIRFNGECCNLNSPNDAIHLGIGMVHQHFVLVEPLSVIENIVMGTDHKGILLDLPATEKKLRSLCDLYDVKIDLDAKIWQLSVGEQQWVEILKALYTGVKLLILDEPTAVLTPPEADRLFSVLRRMKNEGLSIIFITHKLREVMEVSDRVTVLQKGKKIATVNTSDVTSEQLAYMMVGRKVVFRVNKDEVKRGDPILELKDLFAKSDMGLEALHGINLVLHRSEILSIAGVAGNGQKELFEILVGVRKPVSGEVLLRGKNVASFNPRKIANEGLAHVPDDRIGSGLISDFSVEENLILGLEENPPYRKGPFLNKSYIKKFADESVTQFDIVTPSIKQRTSYLSGGNLQKVILARELRQSLNVLLANQPSRGLDVGVIEYVHNKLLDMRRSGIGILLISEDLDEIFNLSDRIAVMFKGRILKIFDAHEANLESIGLLMAGIVDKEAS
ncbi:MAG: ABC transporter ATP-binding protein [Anaerolineales bacterium]|nr:MAG: ABC transporter ATP-binding protein [Anaerolineales bacterium]